MKWKEYVSYDFVYKLIIEQHRKDVDLIQNQMLINKVYPGEITNNSLLMEKNEYFSNRKYRDICSTPLKEQLIF